MLRTGKSKQRKHTAQPYNQQSDDRKAKDVSKNNTKRPYLTNQNQVTRVFIPNLSQLGGPGKFRNYLEQLVHVIVSSEGENPDVHKVISEHDRKGKLRILHRTMLMDCDHLLENYKWQIRQNSQFTNPELQRRPTQQAHRSQKKTSTTCKDSEAVSESDNNINVQFTPEQLSVLDGVGIQRYQYTRRVERPKMSSINKEK